MLAKISGVIATYPSNGGTTGIFSLSCRSWQSEMAKEVSLKDDIFPEVLEVGLFMGNVMDGGDVQLGSAGLGVVKAGEVAVLSGSFWQQIVNIPPQTQPPKDMNIRINPHVIQGLSQAEGITILSGLVMRWFRDAFCDFEKLEASKRSRVKSCFNVSKFRRKCCNSIEYKS